MHRCFHMRSAVHRLASRTPSSNPTNPTNSAVLRSLHTSSIHSIDASSAPSIPLVHTSASLAAAAAGTKLLNYTRTSPRRRPNSKKLPKARMPKIMAPLLTRVWKSGQQSGVRGTISPDDWVNVVKTNRRRLLQLKEKEQFHAWSNFQAMKKHRLDWLKEQGEEPSKEMLERIEQREASIMKISEAARAQLDAPIQPQKTVNKRSIKNNKGIASAARALSHPQTYLQTAFPNEAWRVFSFRLTHYHSHILHKQMEKFREMAKKMGLSPSYPTYLPHRTKRFTIIRSPHVDKTSREQYETRLYSLKIHISTSPEKFYAIKRLSQLTFRLINGPVRMRIETPPNVAIETLNFAPDPLKTDLGNIPPQLYASRDSPGIENILYKLDQHQFPFLKDWQEEILDDKFRGIYPADRDTSGPMHMRADEMDELGAAQAELESGAPSDADADGGSQFIFDENGEFQLEDDLVGEDESIDIDLGEDELSEPEAFDQEAEKLTNPIVRRKRRY